MLPIITFPNDQNESDISLIYFGGPVTEASVLMASSPLFKALVLKRIKLMADDKSATVTNPQVSVISHEDKFFASISFFCSTDNFGRKTSGSMIFEISQKRKLIELLRSAVIPASIATHHHELQHFVEKFDYLKYDLNVNSLTNPKKKNKLRLILGLLVGVSILAYCYFIL